MKMQTLLKQASTCLTMVFFSSCYTGYQMPYFIPEERQRENVYYIPSASGAPYLSKKSEVSFALNYTATPNHESIDAQGSYAFAKKFGITGNISFPTSQYNSVAFTRSEFGVGYFSPLPKNWHFETYAGGGSGHIENYHETGNSKIKCNWVFIQPAFSVSNKENTLQFGIISRFTLAHFQLKDSTFSNDRERFSAKQIMFATKEPNHVFWEPGLTLRYGWQQFLFSANYTMSGHLSNSNFLREKGIFSTGVILKIDATKKKVPKG